MLKDILRTQGLGIIHLDETRRSSLVGPHLLFLIRTLICRLVVVMSLFGDIPRDRTCEEAGVPPPFCICHQYTQIRTDSEFAVRAADTVVSKINYLLSNYSDICERHNLTSIKGAYEIESLQRNFTDYLVMIETSPDGARFDAYVRYKASDKSMAVDGPISRNSMYGDTSYCVTDADLKNYCYCKRQRE